MPDYITQLIRTTEHATLLLHIAQLEILTIGVFIAWRLLRWVRRLHTLLQTKVDTGNEAVPLN